MGGEVTDPAYKAMLKVQTIHSVPARTAFIARAALPHGNRYLTLRDELGSIFDNAMFTHLFSSRGRPAEAPWQLALVTIVQFAENLSDRKAAEAVRTRLDLKYLLGLELDDPGFHFSVLSRFRNRLIKGDAKHLLLDAIIELCKAEGLVKSGGTARTDATYVLANARCLSRLELVGETLRHALNDISKVALDWLQCTIPAEWNERYARRFEEDYHKRTARKGSKLFTQIGSDGFQLLEMVYNKEPLEHLASLPSIETLRRCWLEQFYIEGDEIKRRESGNMQVSPKSINSPFETEARYGRKGGFGWLGYKVHLTETCDDASPHLITHVTTTVAPVHDITQVPIIHDALKDKQLLPVEHIVDSGFMSSELIVESRKFGLELIGPMGSNSHWQQREGGYDSSMFKIDWEQEKVICPQDKQTTKWTSRKERGGRTSNEASFSLHDCRPWIKSHLCVRQPGKHNRRLSFRTQEQHEVLQEARAQQKTLEWRAKYGKRGGIEGTMSQGVHNSGMRRSRYRGLRKSHLQSLSIAAAVNLQRLNNWFQEVPRSKTHRSRFAKIKV